MALCIGVNAAPMHDSVDCFTKEMANMGDKGGKKDRAKANKQSAQKQGQTAKKKAGKQTKQS